MLRFLLALFCVAAPLLADQLSCKDGYTLMADGRCIRPFYVEHLGALGDIIVNGTNECAKEGATLPIIRNEQDESAFLNITVSLVDVSFDPQLILGLVCNASSRRLEWMDGSPMTYKKGPVNLDEDCVRTPIGVALEPKEDRWFGLFLDDIQRYTVLCVVEPIVLPECADYELIANAKDDTKPCFKIINEAKSWRDAQNQCAQDFGSLAAIDSVQENKFFWRSAVSNNVLDDLHIGAYQSPDDGSWKWIDDTSNITDYSNFVGAFPIAGHGSCTAMLTESSTAEWINEDCESQKLPFICRRFGYSTLPKDCPIETPKEGKDILAPGFPSPSIPCEYTFVVGANSVVQLEILALEATPNVDFLDIYEGVVGKNLLASLTGTSPNPSTYTTKSDNVMRVNWKPSEDKRDPQYRGFRIRYRAVPSGK